jgi:hypothetical protein
VHDETRHLGQVLQRDGMWMAVVIVDAAGDQRDLGPRGRQEGGRAAGLGAMVANLQQVDVRHEATFEEHGFDRRLGIPLEQGAEAAAAQHGDDRRIVDVVFGQRRRGIRGRWVQDPQLRRPEEELLPSSRQLIHAGPLRRG